MAYVITEACVDEKDRSCINVCPVDCIYQDSEADRMLFINPDECIDCGACEPECPVAAIFHEDELPMKWKNFSLLNALYFEDKDAARAEVNRLYPAPRQTKSAAEA